MGLVSSPDPAAVGPQTRTRDAILLALAATPDDLARLRKDRSPDDLLRPSQDGGWGVVEVLAHLRDWEEVFLDRLRTVRDEDHPFLPVQDDELWPIERDYRGQDPDRTLERFRQIRADTIDFLTGLPVGDWERTATHGSAGEVTIHFLANHICDHDTEHVGQARDALA